MALLLRGLLWLSVLGGAAVGIGLPTINAVKSVLNKQIIRDQGGNGQAGRDYEDYGYGKGGFGDSRTRTVSAQGGKTEIQTALKGVRDQGGKQKLGAGLEEKFEGWLKTKKLCENSTARTDYISSNGAECSVGNIEFIEKQDKSLFGRIPLAGKDGKKSNVYVQGYKCKQDNAKNPKHSSGIGFGGSRQEGVLNNKKQGKTSIKDRSKYSGCFDAQQSR